MEPNEIFINARGRLRSGWRLAIFAVALFFTVRLLFALAVLLLMFVPGLSEESLAESNWGWVVQAAIFLSAATFVGWVCGRVFEDLPGRALGWALHRGWLRDWLKGSLVGAFSLAVATLIAVIFGGFSFTLNRAATFPVIGKTLLLSGLIFILAAAAEEAMFRGYPLQTMARANLAWLAIVLTSLVFSMGHLANPNVVAGFTFANTALAGVWLSIAYLRTRSLWFPLGVHWAWNWTMGALLGLPVSGIEQLTPNPLWRATAVGPAWLTGGAYGIEGGAACTLALIISTIFIWRTRLLSATGEMLSLTDHERPKWEQSASVIFRSSSDNPTVSDKPTAPQTPLDR
jgi:membrane protease YdiL (CAAX protease family)